MVIGWLDASAAAVTSASILQPALAPETPGTTAPQSTSQKSFSLAEFENDSSSPFDYVELQTINELEELSSVFQALEFLQLQQQFVALGFTKDSIVKALVEAQNDRDKALDLLLG
ncbi:hypothetical protein HPB52_016126 [Rhipicephalus sanguineus]|uniref:UBA domain-containing protein n=1 Tax=Rhipicephalus sanguineus TaxID=34632 RepID=A0A9D4Q136_RHISA|nr:hypothetical protein HPB52_016126 [Rhipicephalus sanguineus]